MKKFLVCIFCLLVGVLFLVPGRPAIATELIYTPVNPSFGGSPLNWSGLLNQATLQNRFKEERPVREPKTPLERFTEQLEYSVFSRMAQRIVDTAFGEDTLKPGEYTFGNYKISVTTDANGITTVITEISTGNTTTIQIPYY
jgi:curli production assembly/transport component CsgF